MFFSLLGFGILWASAWGMLRSMHRPWWRLRWVRRATYAVLAMGIAGIALRAVGLGVSPGPAQRVPLATFVGAALMGPASVIALMAFLSLPIAGLLRGTAASIGWALGRLRSRPAAEGEPSAPREGDAGAPASVSKVEALGPVTGPRFARGGEPAAAERSAPTRRGEALVGRRAVVEGALALVPAAALGAGISGIAEAYRRTRIVRRPMRFDALPSELVGLKILQITDLHLGAFVDLDGVDRLVADAAAHAPDLVLLTGDFSDHLPWLAPALRRVKELAPRLGTFAVLGNHEHYRGALENQRVYEQVGVDLLVDEHRLVKVGPSGLLLAGVDDPGRYETDGHYERAIDRALASAPSDAFSIGLCHRPSGFPALAARSVDLTLAGHTHGAQVGVGERSILERAAPEGRLWGRYALGKRQLYTSSGAGHWFAFRLNCPSEAAIVTLERA